ncbi:MAG: DUF2141 domain-containing protein [Myxococcales bacterium]|nr:DUF2141 domain-containing protein [Myxococcales bacterium]
MKAKIAGAALAGLLALGVHQNGKADRPRIEAHIEDLPNSRGVVRCALFLGREGFPHKQKMAIAGASVRVVRNQATCVFTDMKPGSYALSFFHDENNNRRLDTNWLGMPDEPYGASRNPEPRLGPPLFAPSRFVYRGGHAKLRLRPIQ